jgi:hypothetical protein
LVRTGKGGEGRRLPLCEPVQNAIGQYLAVRPKAVHPYLFCTGVNRRMHGMACTRCSRRLKLWRAMPTGTILSRTPCGTGRAIYS